MTARAASPESVAARRIHAGGVVQAVGFRPHVWGLARRLGLRGWVRNTSSGVDIHVEGGAAALEAFVADLRAGGPPLARIERLDVAAAAPEGCGGFAILASALEEGAYLPVAPDIAVCPDCLRELGDPNDRRHRYPFINCTNCGPRFTIVRDIPYDRPATTMAGFPLCPDCAREYADPADRRFHAQPVACPACGPQLRLEQGASGAFAADGAAAPRGEAALQRARELIARGAVVAVKGLGGFHLACDAGSSAAVATLRERKGRAAKPFALMAPDLAAVARHCEVSEPARALLESRERPVVLLPWRPEAHGLGLDPGVAPGRDRLGLMLPYAPLHHLLLERAAGFPEILVMTSGNASEEPICHLDDDARRRLAPLADAILLHDRPIHVRCDDSVVAEVGGGPYFFRRSRGYAPLPLALPFDTPPALAVGGELKNAFCLGRDRRAFLSHHVGELEYFETLRAFEEGLAHFERLFRVRPELIAHDLHPDYQSTRHALARARAQGLRAIGVQHHHAHVAACMADNGLTGEEPVIGVAFDGTGYGPDGAIWGGEILVADYGGYRRACHLAYCPLPGGDAATRNPCRCALAWLRQAGVEWTADLPPVAAARPGEVEAVGGQLRSGLNAPPTSSVGRLVDAVASLLGICHRATCEAQAACELEAVAGEALGRVEPPDELAAAGYRFALEAATVDPASLVRALAAGARAGEAAALLAARFHVALAEMVLAVCRRVASESGTRRVALSGGVWQNLLLLRLTEARLAAGGFEVLRHRQAPAGDGGLALGQLAVAAWRARS